MPKFAANLTMLFTELPFLERFAAAREAGFTAVEYLFPYDFPKEELARQLRANGLKQVLHNLPAGDWAGGERGIACHPGREAEFREGVARAIAYAHALDCPQLNCLAGKLPAGVTREQAQATLVANLRFAAAELKKAGLRLLVEPINTFDIPGFFLTRSDQALALIEEVGSDALLLQYDIYHAQRMEGELAGTLGKHLARIGHIQLADNPGRNEPGTGEINYGFLFGHLDALGWKGFIGCEYKPKTTTLEGLGWLKKLGSAAPNPAYELGL
ncbi:hydroxypyruvate isomerase [Ramlibacter sp. G-1-2-2]|uniref:Hydroxypyruvate isomerase n=1 Tax=Ramlibacter agri TaxID=2728837 RepID=A0A848H1P6_9BURK|nr:hydroxypyruvate isomerase [Ramlibacter agri]NML43572.1 hydroxypyruvate isomerase [Ramlibacter agri]